MRRVFNLLPAVRAVSLRLILMIVLGNIAVSWGLLILIGLVQIIIYPGFQRIPNADFTIYHRWYVFRISLAVAVVWLSTLILQVPIHKCLQNGKDDVLIRRLVATNWIRTAAWSLKALVVTMAAVQVVG
jgi:hypothetical protein